MLENASWNENQNLMYVLFMLGLILQQLNFL